MIVLYFHVMHAIGVSVILRNVEEIQNPVRTWPCSFQLHSRLEVVVHDGDPSQFGGGDGQRFTAIEWPGSTCPALPA
jgi:hypothetical protein